MHFHVVGIASGSVVGPLGDRGNMEALECVVLGGVVEPLGSQQ